MTPNNPLFERKLYTTAADDITSALCTLTDELIFNQIRSRTWTESVQEYPHAARLGLYLGRFALDSQTNPYVGALVFSMLSSPTTLDDYVMQAKELGKKLTKLTLPTNAEEYLQKLEETRDLLKIVVMDAAKYADYQEGIEGPGCCSPSFVHAVVRDQNLVEYTALLGKTPQDFLPEARLPLLKYVA